MTSRWGRVLKKTVPHGFCFLPRSVFSVEKPCFSQPSCSPLLRPVSAFGSVSRGIKLLCPLPCHLWELTSPFLAVLLLVWPVCLLPLSVGKGFFLCTWICLPLEALLSISGSLFLLTSFSPVPGTYSSRPILLLPSPCSDQGLAGHRGGRLWPGSDCSSVFYACCCRAVPFLGRKGPLSTPAGHPPSLIS
uniref:Uncharacterized protein n=1 Tax=Myotis myotis TaxID=51298 RepID=A0A7J7ZX45_MYOMY|nr:hypothetical protein mMyoMyo1_009606 [Myotis myotis]